MADVYVGVYKFFFVVDNEEIYHDIAVCSDKFNSTFDAAWGKEGVISQMHEQDWRMYEGTPIAKKGFLTNTKSSHWEYSGMVGKNAWTFTKKTRNKWVFVSSEGRRVFYSARRLRRFLNIEGFDDFAGMKRGQAYDVYTDCDVYSGCVIRLV